MAKNGLIFLSKQGISFTIRLKKDAYTDSMDGFRDKSSITTETKKHQKLSYADLEKQAYLPKYKDTGVAKFIEIESHRYSIVILRNPNLKNTDEPLLYFISSCAKKRKVIKVYPIRWTIECCFKHLKSNGFNMEAMNVREMNVRDPLKIELMMAILTFLYVLCIRQGLT